MPSRKIKNLGISNPSRPSPAGSGRAAQLGAVPLGPAQHDVINIHHCLLEPQVERKAVGCGDGHHDGEEGVLLPAGGQLEVDILDNLVANAAEQLELDVERLAGLRVRILRF